MPNRTVRECKLLTNPVRVHKQLAASSKVELGKTTLYTAEGVDWQARSELSWQNLKDHTFSPFNNFRT